MYANTYGGMYLISVESGLVIDLAGGALTNAYEPMQTPT